MRKIARCLIPVTAPVKRCPSQSDTPENAPQGDHGNPIAPGDKKDPRQESKDGDGHHDGKSPTPQFTAQLPAPKDHECDEKAGCSGAETEDLQDGIQFFFLDQIFVIGNIPGRDQGQSLDAHSLQPGTRIRRDLSPGEAGIELASF